MPITSTIGKEFHPDIIEYFILNGFEQPQTQPIPGALLFIKGDTAVHFWKNKIEVRKNDTVHWNLLRAYMGFKGDVVELMMLMHLMDVINLKDVKNAAQMEQVESKLFEIA